MKDRTVRSLVALEESASTARVLNLSATLRRSKDDPALKARPFFESRILNASIIVKHRIRPTELELFSKPRATATKIMTPIDGSDLKLGARFLGLRIRGKRPTGVLLNGVLYRRVVLVSIKESEHF